MVTPIAIRKLRRISIPLPPPHLFDELLGCTTRIRFFAFHWSRRAHVPVLHDGRLETIGAVEPYRIWRYHRHVMAALVDYNTGDADEQAEHWLLVDRKTRALYAGEAADVLLVLGFQLRGVIDPLPEDADTPPPVTPVTINTADMLIAAKSFRKQRTVSLKLLHELDSWLTNIKGGGV